MGHKVLVRLGVVVAGQFSEPTRADQGTSGSIQLVGQSMITCRVLVKVHVWFKCVESNFDHANDQLRLDRDTFYSTIGSSPRKCEVQTGWGREPL